MKTIAIFSAYCFPHLGGIETYIDNLIKELINLKYRIILVTTDFTDNINYKDSKNLKILKLPIYNTFKNRYPIIKKNKMEKEIIKQLDEYDISSIIVNTRFHLTSHVGAKYGKKHNIPVLLIEHGSSYITLNNKFIDFFANRYENYLTRRIKNKVDGFYGVSERCNQWLKKLKIDASGVFYNAINANIYDNNKKYIKKNKNVVITYAGRILAEKGVINLLDAFMQLDDNKKCILNIAGDGPILNELKEKYKAKNIHFLGRLKHDDVLKLCAETDIFVYPSMYPEGLPTSILEAGIMKCAIVATDRGGTKEVVNNNNLGYIVEENVPDLVKKLNYLIKHPEVVEKMKENIHKRVNEKFVWKETAKCVIEEINKYEKED